MRAARPLAPLLSLGLLSLAAGCGDDSVGDGSETASASAGTTGAETASATATSTAGSATDAATATTDAATATATDSTSTGATTDASATATVGTESESASDSAGTDTTAATDSDSDSGSDTDTDTGTGTDTGTTGGVDEPLSAVAPSWLRGADGLNSIGVPLVAPLPDGDVVALITGSLYAHKIVLAEGGDDETILDTPYTTPAYARFDGATGALLEARTLAKLGQGTPYGMSVFPRQIEAASDGDLLVVGTWTGTAEFFPGTADAATHVTEMKTIGNVFHRAEDPFVFRMDPDGGVSWFVRGKTPPPIAATWFNYGRALAMLPDDGLIFTGDYELPGFIAAANTGGAKTLSGSQRSYFARLGVDGAPAWIYPNTRQLQNGSLTSGADGGVYALLPADATLLEGSSAPLKTIAEPDLNTTVVARLDPEGGALWSANFATAGLWWFLRGVQAMDGGGLLVYGTSAKDVLLRDAGDATMTLPIADDESWIAGLSADGEGLWLRSLGPTVFALGPTLPDEDGAWLVVRVSDPYELEIAGETLALPDLGYAEGATATVLLHVDAAGEKVAAQVVGVDLPILDLAWSGPERDGFLIAGGYSCKTAKPMAVAEGGEGLVALKAGCDMEPNDDQRGYVAAVPRAD